MGRVFCALAFLACACAGQDRPFVPTGGDTDQIQPALTAAATADGRLWIVAGYTDLSAPDLSRMGLSLRAPDGTWSGYPPLVPDAEAFRPAGDAWLAAAQNGGQAYYVSLLDTVTHPPSSDEVGDGLALAVIDVRTGTPQIRSPRRIDFGAWPSWDEPTIAATHPVGAVADTIIVAGTPLGPDTQDVVAVLVSRNGGESFHYAAPIHAPQYPGHAAGAPDNTLVRPFLQQDPRPGHECHAYLAFGVYYATALSSSTGIQPPACQSEPNGCRSLAETETQDCGETWDEPVFIAIDTGEPSGEDYRGFSYAVAVGGTRFVLFGDEDVADAPILLKRTAPDTRFSVVTSGRWDDGPMETIAIGPGADGGRVRRWRPTLAASDRVAALWIEESVVSHDSAVWMSTSDAAAPSWTAAQWIDQAGVACDGVTFPSDDYMGVVPEAPFASAATTFVVAWAPFAACGSQKPRRIQFKSVR